MEKKRRRIYHRNFKLGQRYVTRGGQVLKFIKVTPKGFNLLIEDQHRCFFKQHIYSKDWANKVMPPFDEINEVKNCAIPDGFWFKDYKEKAKKI